MMDPYSYRILVGCETSDAVRSAFAARGFDAWSCDILASDVGSNKHLQMDIRDAVSEYGPWDLMTVMHPPCTYLCNSGVQWLSRPTKNGTVEERWQGLREGCELFIYCLTADIPNIAVENPVMHGHAKKIIAESITGFDKATQTVQPWWFGEEAFKATGLHLKNLPKLIPTNKLSPPKKETEEHKRWSAVHRAPPGPNRWKIRSKTFDGVAKAMASQWGDFILEQAELKTS